MNSPKPLFKLATRTQPHNFGPMRIISASKTSTGLSQTERTCARCGATKITVHGKAYAWREWRLKGDTVQVSDNFRPECGG